MVVSASSSQQQQKEKFGAMKFEEADEAAEAVEEDEEEQMPIAVASVKMEPMEEEKSE
jgi:divalent metal cation (Fe/Co/Zn/Cd) transporter